MMLLFVFSPLSLKKKLRIVVKIMKRSAGRRGRPPKYDPSNLPEFLKCYLPELNSKELVIPSAFVKYIGEKIPKKVTLKNLKAKVWNVELDYFENKFLMKKGWESFVIDNSLERGEFLTFAYEGKAVFTVKIFSLSGCKRDDTTATDDKHCPHVKVKQHPNLDQTFSHHTHDGEKTHSKREFKFQPESQAHEVLPKGVPNRTIESENVQFRKVLDGSLYETPRNEVEIMERPAKRRRGRPRKFDQFNLPSFSREYLPEHNSKHLVMPPDLVKNFSGKIPQKVTLKNLEGKVWNVELDNSENRLIMKKGWKSFVIDNSLQKGQLLTFVYEGMAVFTVKILSISGSKEDETKATNDKPCPDAKLKLHPNLDHTYDGKKMHLKRQVEPESQVHEVFRKGVPERTIESQNIHFTKVVDGGLYETSIPAAVFWQHNVKPPKVNTCEMVFLRNQNGVLQEAKLVHRQDRVVVTSGWKEFMLKNNMVKGDICKFEIVLGKGRKVKEILLLQITHRKTEITQKVQAH